MTGGIMVGIVDVTDENRLDLMRFSIRLRYVGEKCPQCGVTYKSPEDWWERNPIAGYNGEVVDIKCWEAYCKRNGDDPNLSGTYQKWKAGGFKNRSMMEGDR